MTTIELECPHCGQVVGLPRSMAGGKANCPECRKAVDVPGGPDVLFWSLVTLGGLFILAVSALVFFLGSPVGGLATLGIGALVLTGIVLAS